MKISKEKLKTPSGKYLLHVINCHSLFSDYGPGFMGIMHHLCNGIEILVSCLQEAARAQSQQLNPALPDGKAILNISVGKTLRMAVQVAGHSPEARQPQ